MATCCFNCSTNAIIGSTNSFSTNTKTMLMGTQIHKVLVAFVLSSTTAREVNWFFYMCVIRLKIINKHCLNLIQKACVRVVVIRSKTQ